MNFEIKKGNRLKELNVGDFVQIKDRGYIVMEIKGEYSLRNIETGSSFNGDWATLGYLAKRLPEHAEVYLKSEYKFVIERK